jgi:hypothetical protein
MRQLPESLLQDIYWSFAEPVPKTPDELVTAALDYADANEASSTATKLLEALPFRDCVVQYEYYVRAEPDDWQAKSDQVRIVSSGPALTGAELLWELHVACHATVGQQDHHFFEGLELIDASSGVEPPVYEVHLGS